MNIFNDLNLVRSFVCIVETGSISNAARHMGLKQPTVSRYLQTLEQRCGTSLVHRNTHRMQLSTAGQQFLEDARLVLSVVDEAEQRMSDDKNKVQGHIRLFSTVDFGQSVVTQLVTSFIEANPQITFELAYSNRATYMLEEGSDVGIIAGHIIDDTVVAVELKPIKRGVYAATNFLSMQGYHSDPQNPEDLTSLPWLALSRNQFSSKERIKFTSNNRKEQIVKFVSPVLTSEGVSSLSVAAQMGAGFAILPNWLASEYVEKNRLVRLLDEWEPESLPANIVYPSQRNIPNRIRRFIEFSKEYMNSILDK